MLAKLQASEVIYYVAEESNNVTFNYKTKTISWDPDMGVLTNEGHELSASQGVRNSLMPRRICNPAVD